MLCDDCHIYETARSGTNRANHNGRQGFHREWTDSAKVDGLPGGGSRAYHREKGNEMGRRLRAALTLVFLVFALLGYVGLAQASPGGGKGGPDDPNCENLADDDGDTFIDEDDPDCRKPGCIKSDQTPNKCFETNLDTECADDDDDGICNSQDDCPFDPGPASNNGCPVCPGDEDTDGDGVCDDDDDCPTQPGPAPSGCPPACPSGDTDNDGVCNDVDQCPTVPGPASNNGCPIVTEQAECRARVVNLFGALILLEANAPLDPCATQDASVLNEDQLRVGKSVTDEDAGTADAELVGLGGPADPGTISVCGAHADDDGAEDAYILLITSGGEEALRVGDGSDIALPDLAADEDNGIFFTSTDGGKAQVVAVVFDGEDQVVLCEAEAR